MGRKQDELTWEDVLKVHRDRRGVFHYLGQVASIVFSTMGSHGDTLNRDQIQYVLPEKASYLRDKAALIRACQEKTSFIVFRKLGVNRYRNLGAHLVRSYATEPGRTIFVIEPDFPAG